MVCAVCVATFQLLFSPLDKTKNKSFVFKNKSFILETKTSVFENKTFIYKSAKAIKKNKRGVFCFFLIFLWDFYLFVRI